MNSENIQLITDYLDKLAAKIGVGAETVWPWLVRQQYVEAYWWLFILFISSVVSTSTCAYMWGNFERLNESKYYIIASIIISIGFFSVLSFIVSVFGFIFEFQDVFNPDYAALKDLISSIR